MGEYQLAEQTLPRKSRPRPNSDGRREQIVNAALKVMISDGVYHATTRKIAEAAGVNVATLHYHFHDKEEIILSVMSVLASNYRGRLDKRFGSPQPLHDRIEDLLAFIWGEIESAPGEQLVLQEMTLYVLRVPQAAHLAAEKEREIKQLYAECLSRCSDVSAADTPRIAELSNFIYACFVGILNQWLATRDTALLLTTTRQLVHAARSMWKTL